MSLKKWLLATAALALACLAGCGGNSSGASAPDSRPVGISGTIR